MTLSEPFPCAHHFSNFLLLYLQEEFRKPKQRSLCPLLWQNYVLVFLKPSVAK